MSENAPADPEVVTVMDVVDTLEELVGGGRRVPFTPNVVVNEEDILELVDRIRVALPDDLVAARHTMEEREQLLERSRRESDEVGARAQEEADRLVRDAQARAATLVDDSTITAAATAQAAVTVSEAETAAAAQRAAADDYARDVMQHLQEHLEKALGTVRAGLDALPTQEQPKRRRGR